MRLVRKPPGGGWRERALEQTATPRKPARARARQPNRAGFSSEPLRLPRETRSLHARCGYFGKLPAAHAYDAQHRQMRDACRRRTTPPTSARGRHAPISCTREHAHATIPYFRKRHMGFQRNLLEQFSDKTPSRTPTRHDAACCKIAPARDASPKNIPQHPNRLHRSLVYKIDDKL